MANQDLAEITRYRRVILGMLTSHPALDLTTRTLNELIAMVVDARTRNAEDAETIRQLREAAESHAKDLARPDVPNSRAKPARARTAGARRQSGGTQTDG